MNGPNASGGYTTTINAAGLAGYFDGMYSGARAFRLGLRSTENRWNPHLRWSVPG